MCIIVKRKGANNEMAAEQRTVGNAVIVWIKKNWWAW